MKTATYDQLLKHLERFGPSGVLESANHLPVEERDKLEKLVKAARKQKKRR